MAPAPHHNPSSDVDLWLMDTGSEVDVISKDEAGDLGEFVRPHAGGATLCTVRGETVVQHEVDVFIPELRHKSKACVLPDTPPLLSLGMRCQNMGFKFVWEPSRISRCLFDHQGKKSLLW